MKPPPDDRPFGATPDAPLAEREAADDEARLSALVAQREAFRRDVQRIEAALASGTDERFGLYERLLRCRRISGKLENRIRVVRLQQAAGRSLATR